MGHIWNWEAEYGRYFIDRSVYLYVCHIALWLGPLLLTQISFIPNMDK